MKKYKWGIVALAVVASFVACTQSKNKENDSANSTLTKERQAEDSVLTQQKEGIEVNEDEEETFRESKRIFQASDRELYLERDSLSYYCYSVKNGVRERMKFGNIYLDDGAFRLTYYKYRKYIYIVGDIMPNSNGWVCRFFLYRINTDNFSMKLIDAGAAIRFTPKEIVMAEARLTNEDEAECTAAEIWVMHDVHYDIHGNRIREEKKEYDCRELEHRYGEELVNSKGL
jgi:hypothetical protein